MNPASIGSWSRRGRAVLLAWSILGPGALASAQLPAGSYLLQDPTRGILGMATAAPRPGGWDELHVEWIGPLGGVGHVALWYDPRQGFYVGEVYGDRHFFHTYVLHGVAHYTLSKHTLTGDLAIITSGTIE